MKVLVLIGSTSALGEALLRNNTEYPNVICLDRKVNENDISITDIQKNDFCELIKIVPEKLYKVIYLSSKKYPLDEIDADIQLNIRLPMKIFNDLYNMPNCEFCYIGSQGDIHASPHNSLYNSSKRYVSSFLEGQIHIGNQKCKVSVIKPWLFKSKMYQKKSAFSVNVDKLATAILPIKHKSGVHLFPIWTYLLVLCVYVVMAKSFFYKILQQSNKN